MDKKSVLIIEDDEFLFDMYKTRFEVDDFNVHVARDGEAGLQALSEGLKPDIILLDIVMPKMDGIEVLSNIKNMSDCKDIPVLMLTNLGQKEEIDKALKIGALDYFVKANFTPSEVVSKVKNILKM